MQYLLICLFLYGILIVADIIPAIKQKDKKALYVSIPIYFITLVLNVLLAFGVILPSPNKAIEGILISMFHMK